MGRNDPFFEPDEYSNTDQQLGYEAGFRGDELLDGHSEIYLEYYEIGRATKEQARERHGHPASGNGRVDLRRNQRNSSGD